MESIINAAFLGLVEGLTEFIPVSSTGHLIIVSEFLKLDHTKSDSFNIIIQLGAILAVVYLYRERFYDFFNWKKIQELPSLIKTKNPDRLNLIHIFVAIMPILMIGFVSRKWIKTYLFNTDVVVASLILVGILMIIVEKFKPMPTVHSLDKLTYKEALIIGLGQCFALIPGVSRSGATMLTGMLIKIDVKTSADFSFLISVPVIAAATIYEFIKVYGQFTSADLWQLLVGFGVSFIVAIMGIKGFLIVLKRLSITPFAIYRIFFGLFYYFFSR
ncbi:MAG: undecaprenyl-diphosphate phosphatase [Bacteriovoracaceae bacterium]|nr:undecaprenyl-diphosphate phosphatase [Bacteriovoracaceae bacterium]